MGSSGLHQGPADPWVRPPLGGPSRPPLLCAGRVSFVSHFCEVHPPTLVSVLVQNLKTKYGTNKRNSAGLESREFNLYYFEIKGALIT